MTASLRPAYKILTGRLTLRCWEFDDIPALVEAIHASLPELQRWLRWAADEPLPLSERVQRMRHFRCEFDSDQVYHYGLFERQSGMCIGSISLKPIYTNMHEIGYWLRTDRTGQGYMSEACAALVKVAFEIEKSRVVEIRHRPGNERSAAIPRRLGFQREGILRLRALTQENQADDLVIWSLLNTEYASSLAAGTETFAFDALGNPIFFG